MQKIKVIIGASYGDEGKGLATDFFGAQAAKYSGSTVRCGSVNVLTNGGPQRGHTVELPGGLRHVFKHFGAAAFRGAATYYAEQFLINPMEFVREYDELCGLHRAPEAYMHPRCRFSTPWDMLVNQLLQEKRGIHNSCGFGIWETVLRYDRGFGIPFGTFTQMNREDRISYLKKLRDGYFAGRLRELGLVLPDGGCALSDGSCVFPDGGSHLSNGSRRLSNADTAGLAEFFYSDALLFHYEKDCETMRCLCPLRGEDFLKGYPTVLFENAQGLLLDGNNPSDTEFTTPSTTGAGKVLQTIENTFHGADVEICYVTRSYLTRHGDGSLENELTGGRLAALLPGVSSDATNVENRFQGILRYGMMDVDSLTARISADYARTQGTVRNHYHPSVMVTHLNEYAGIDTDLLAGRFGTLYLSNGRTCGDVFRETAAIGA